MYIMEVNHLPSHCNWLKLSRNWMCLCAQRCVYYAGGGAFQAPKSSAKVQLWMSVCARARARVYSHTFGQPFSKEDSEFNTS